MNKAIGGITINIYEMMTTGEKRSLTSTLNKHFVAFEETNPIKMYENKEKWLNDFIAFWLTNSVKSNVSWTKNSYHEQCGFESEMKERILHMFSDSLKNLSNEHQPLVENLSVKGSKERKIENVLHSMNASNSERNVTLKPLRSKKKRIKKKREKKLEQISIRDVHNLKEKMKSFVKKATS